MDINVYNVIKGPVISGKAFLLNKKLNKLMLKVHPKANKQQIKYALEKLFNVKVEKVNTLRRKGKIRQVKRITVQRPLTKRVIVTLAEGYKLDFFDQTGSGTVSHIPETVKTERGE
ncbi:MAG: 50S ribosomal protein L23 [Candidatus Babeliales bacterium]|jgi:large subunit ribosomal protein L23